jgi:hypothetical protein
MKHYLLVMSVLLTSLAFNPLIAQATDYNEASQGDLSNDWLNPNLLLLSYGQIGSNGISGNNIVTGTTGRVNSVIDRDYLHVVVPTGYVWSEMRLGSQSSVGGSASFVGLASGTVMINPNTASNATGLLGYHLYGAQDLMQDILDNMAVSTNGASGFTTPLAAGDYTLWIQELATGSFNYRFNLILTPVPEPETNAMLLIGLGVLALMERRKRKQK